MKNRKRARQRSERKKEKMKETIFQMQMKSDKFVCSSAFACLRRWRELKHTTKFMLITINFRFKTKKQRRRRHFEQQKRFVRDQQFHKFADLNSRHWNYRSVKSIIRPADDALARKKKTFLTIFVATIKMSFFKKRSFDNLKFLWLFVVKNYKTKSSYATVLNSKFHSWLARSCVDEINMKLTRNCRRLCHAQQPKANRK